MSPKLNLIEIMQLCIHGQASSNSVFQNEHHIDKILSYGICYNKKHTGKVPIFTNINAYSNKIKNV